MECTFTSADFFLPGGGGGGGTIILSGQTTKQKERYPLRTEMRLSRHRNELTSKTTLSTFALKIHVDIIYMCAHYLFAEGEGGGGGVPRLPQHRPSANAINYCDIENHIKLSRISLKTNLLFYKRGGGGGEGN